MELNLTLTFLLFIFVIIVFINLKSKYTQLQEELESLRKALAKQQKVTPSQQPVKIAEHTKQEPVLASSKTADDIIVISENKPHANSTRPTVIFANPSPNITAAARENQTDITQQKAQESVKESSDDEILTKLFHWLVKENPVAKLAIIILFFGLSYLLKYSIEHELLSPEVRILGSLVLGIVLFGVGFHLRSKKNVYALVLQGGAIGVLYLTIFAAIKLYALIPLLLAFILLVIICSVSVIFAILQNAISLAIIACVGGYLAPILLSTGSGNHIALFSYYLMLSLAILSISIKQSWRTLNLIGFGFTFVVAVLWGIKSYQEAFYPECQAFIIANLLIYGILAVLLSIRSEKREQYQHAIDLILLFGAPLSGFSLQYAITEHLEYAPAFSSLAFGLFYLTGAYIILKQFGAYAKRTALYGLAIGLGFSTLAIPLALSANWTALAWLIEGTVISWAALTQKQYRLAFAGTVITLLGCLSAFAGYQLDQIDNAAFIMLYGVMSAILLFNACLWHHYQKQCTFAETFKNLFVILSALVWAIWIIASVFRVSDGNYTPEKVVLFFVIAVWLWCFIGKKLQWQTLEYAVISLWPILFIVIISSYFTPYYYHFNSLWELTPILAMISGYVYLYSTINRSVLDYRSQVILHISLFWLIIGFIACKIETALIYLPWGYTTLETSITLLSAGVIVFILYLLQRGARFPIAQFSKPYWFIGLAPVALFITIRLLSALTDDGQMINWVYIPLLNPLEESAIFSWLMLALWLKKVNQIYKNETSYPAFYYISLSILIGLTFLWGNSVILRSLSYWLNINWSLYSLWYNNLVQIIFSLTWTLTALILIAVANHYALRRVWFSGAILQGIVIVKLIFVDSVELDGLYRAFAFIGVAILMLIIGYLAPLPPKQLTASKMNNTNELDKG